MACARFCCRETTRYGTVRVSRFGWEDCLRKTRKGKGLTMALSNKRRAQLLAGPYTRLLAEHEKAVSELYGAFAETFPLVKPFWSAMAQEEIGHMNRVLKIEEKLMDGEWAFRRPPYTTSALAESLTRITAKREALQRDGISLREAFRLALDIETGLAEATYFEVLNNDTAEMMEVIRSLADESARHAKRLQLEAARLKWRILGRRTARPKSSPKRSSVELQANVKAAQANMLGLLVSLQEAASALYSAYAQRLSSRSDFWARMAAEEMQHAAMLRSLYKVLEQGKVFYNVERFNRKAIQAETDFILDAEFQARHGRCSIYSAVNAALRVERSLCKSGFYATATSDAPQFRIIAASMMRHLDAHISRLDAEAGRAIDLGAAAREQAPPIAGGT